MAMTIQFTFKQGNELDTLIAADATLSENHSFSAEVTSFPVEKGSKGTDNVQAKPDGLRVEAYFADFPLNKAGRQQVPTGATVTRPAQTQSRSAEALASLRRLQTEGIVVTVATGLKVYENMVISDIQVVRDSKIKNGLRLALTFQQIVIVDTQTVTVTKPAERKGQIKKKDGDKTGKPTSPAVAEKRQSVFRSFVGGDNNPLVQLRKAIAK